MISPPPTGKKTRFDRWLVIVGLGRLGSALALQLRKHHWRVAVAANRRDARLRAHKLRLPIADEQIIRDAAIFFLSVPDREVADAAAAVAKLPSRAALVHCAGALSLSVLEGAAKERSLGSFHPLCAVSSSTDAFEGYSVAIGANRPGLARLLRRIAIDLGLRPFSVRENQRAQYHAGAVLCAAGLVTLAEAGIETLHSAGVPRTAAEPAILALMRSALNGAEQRGLVQGLTGPVPRGDGRTIELHLASLPPRTRALYAALGLRAVKLLSRRLPIRTRRQLDAILRFKFGPGR